MDFMTPEEISQSLAESIGGQNDTGQTLARNPEGQAGPDQALAVVATQAPEGGAPLEAAAPQGGRTQGATVSGARQSTPKSKGVTVITNARGIERIVFRLDDNRRLIKRRPAASSDNAIFWRWIDRQYLAAKRGSEDSAALNEIAEACARRRPSIVRGSAGAAPSSPSPLTDARNGLSFDLAKKPLPPAVKAEIERRFFLKLMEDTRSSAGQLYVPGPRLQGIKGQRGSLCGKFPHMVTKRSGKGLANTNTPVGSVVYFCGLDHVLSLTTRLVERKEDGSEVFAKEEDLLKLVHGCYSAAARTKHGHFEKTLTIFASLEFAEGDEAGKPVSGSAFKGAPTTGMWLPRESAPYQGGATEKEMRGGIANLNKLKFAKITAQNNMVDHLKHQRVRIAIHTLNPMLNDLKGFTVHSLPFLIKSVLHNDVEKNERYIAGADGQPVALPKPNA